MKYDKSSVLCEACSASKILISVTYMGRNLQALIKLGHFTLLNILCFVLFYWHQYVRLPSSLNVKKSSKIYKLQFLQHIRKAENMKIQFILKHRTKNPQGLEHLEVEKFVCLYVSVSSGRELALSYVTFSKSLDGCCDQM